MKQSLKVAFQIKAPVRDVRVDASGGDIWKKKKRNFNKIVLNWECGTGGDADGRKRRKPFASCIEAKSSFFLLFINIRAAGIESLMLPIMNPVAAAIRG